MTYCSEPSAWTVNSFCDLTLKSTLPFSQRVPSPRFFPTIPPSRPWIRIVVSQGAPRDLPEFFHKLTSGPCRGMGGLVSQLLTDTRHCGNLSWQLIVNQGKLAFEIMRAYSNYSEYSQWVTQVPHGQQANAVRRLSFSFIKLFRPWWCWGASVFLKCPWARKLNSDPAARPQCEALKKNE